MESISKSYFINKTYIRNKNKRLHEKIKAQEDVKSFIINSSDFDIEAKVILTGIINDRINKNKDKISFNTIIYNC